MYVREDLLGLVQCKRQVGAGPVERAWQLWLLVPFFF